MIYLSRIIISLCSVMGYLEQAKGNHVLLNLYSRPEFETLVGIMRNTFIAGCIVIVALSVARIFFMLSAKSQIATALVESISVDMVYFLTIAGFHNLSMHSDAALSPIITFGSDSVSAGAVTPFPLHHALVVFIIHQRHVSLSQLNFFSHFATLKNAGPTKIGTLLRRPVAGPAWQTKGMGRATYRTIQTPKHLNYSLLPV